VRDCCSSAPTCARSTTKNDEAKLEVVFFVAHDHSAPSEGDAEPASAGAADNPPASPVTRPSESPDEPQTRNTRSSPPPSSPSARWWRR
jgi:hypothetical protein